jgi:hydroxylysine kinase
MCRRNQLAIEDDQKQNSTQMLPFNPSFDISARRSTDLEDREISTLLDGRFGIEGPVARLQSERDLLFVVGPAQSKRFVLRISHPDELPGTLLCQNQALGVLARQDPSLPIPHVLPSRSGKLIEWIESSSGPRAARLFTYMEGIPVGDAPRSIVQREQLGSCLACLDRGLARFEFAGVGAAGVWNMAKAHELIPLLARQPNPDIRKLAARVLQNFTEETRPRVKNLPHQFIHNDFNAKNVLVKPDEPTRITGIIDFGDLIWAPRIFDLAVAMGKLVSHDDPIGEGRQIFRAYCAQLPLDADEIAVLQPLICVRLAMQIAVRSYRQASSDVTVDSTLIQASADLLLKLQRSIGAASNRAFRVDDESGL